MSLGTLGKHAPGKAGRPVPVTATWKRAHGIAAPAYAINGALDARRCTSLCRRLAKPVRGGHTATVPTAAYCPDVADPARSSTQLTSFLETV
ncbi:hypothetical protein [Streptomyces sp. NPDC001880]